MSIPAGHLLANRAWRVTPGGAFADRCGCGLIVYGAGLPQLWARHSDHLRVVKALSMRNHPSRRQP